jgi:hypothetical protein
MATGKPLTDRLSEMPDGSKGKGIRPLDEPIPEGEE